jgi:hypothetical protein
MGAAREGTGISFESGRFALDQKVNLISKMGSHE